MRKKQLVSLSVVLFFFSFFFFFFSFLFSLFLFSGVFRVEKENYFTRFICRDSKRDLASALCMEGR